MRGTNCVSTSSAAATRTISRRCFPTAGAAPSCSAMTSDSSATTTARAGHGSRWSIGEAPSPQPAVNGFGVELPRVERAADPLQHVLVALVLRVADRLQEVGVAPHAAAVLRRAGPLARHAPRVAGAGL